MKTKQILFFGLMCLSTQLVKAQATVANATNTTTATSYLGSGATSNFDVLFKRNNVNAGLLGTTKTTFGVNALAMPNSVSIGVGAGQFSSGIGNNTYIGQNSGKGLSSIAPNQGNFNTFVGNSSGSSNRFGNYNTYVGHSAGDINSFGNSNIFIGAFAGRSESGIGNIFIGNNSGSEDSYTGNNNIYIGHGAGFTESNGNTLVIDNAGETNSAFIWGDMAGDKLKFHAKVGIGKGGNFDDTFGNFPTKSGAINNVANYNLFVKGGILTEEIRVSLATTWADYVFSKILY